MFVLFETDDFVEELSAQFFAFVLVQLTNFEQRRIGTLQERNSSSIVLITVKEKILPDWLESIAAHPVLVS